MQDLTASTSPAVEGPFLEGHLAGEIAYMKEHAYRFRWITENLPASSESLRIIDIGPTPHTLKIKELYAHYEIAALDRTELLQERLNAVGVQLKTCNLDDEPIPFASDSFDVVIFTEVLEHIFAPPSEVLREVGRILRKGGKLLLSVPNIARLMNRLKLLFGITPLKHPDITMQKNWIHGHGHVHEYTVKEITGLLAACGFQIARMDMLQPPVRSPLREDEISTSYALAKTAYLAFAYLVPNFRQTICIECHKR